MRLDDLGLEPPPTMPSGYTARRAATMPAPAPEPSADPSAAPEWVAAVRNWVAPPFLAAEPVMVEFAVGKLIQAGKVGALVAAGGTGKTTLLLNLAMCHATGREFLGMRVTRGTFVLLSEPPRVLRRLQSLRGWSHEEVSQVFAGGPGAGRSDGYGVPRPARLAVGGHRVHLGQDRLHCRDAAPLGAPA